VRGGRSSRRHCRCRSPSAPRGVPDRFQLVYSRRTRLIPITPRNSLIPTRPVPALLWVDDTDDKSIASAAGPLRLRSTCSYRHARSARLSQRTPRPRPAERDACNPLCINFWGCVNQRFREFWRELSGCGRYHQGPHRPPETPRRTWRARQGWRTWRKPLRQRPKTQNAERILSRRFALTVLVSFSAEKSEAPRPGLEPGTNRLTGGAIP